VIALDGERSCAGAGRRDRFAYERNHAAEVRASDSARRLNWILLCLIHVPYDRLSAEGRTGVQPHTGRACRSSLVCLLKHGFAAFY